MIMKQIKHWINSPFVIALFVFSFTGCALPVAYYQMKLDNYERVFSDDYVTIEFSFPYKMTASRNRDFTATNVHPGISITLTNKTDKIIVIYWNQVSMKDYTGASGKSVMHTGIKYINCAESKVPTTLPGKGVLRDMIIPCYGLWKDSARWNSNMLPEPYSGAKATLGLYLPLKIGEELKAYNFDFSGAVK